MVRGVPAEHSLIGIAIKQHTCRSAIALRGPARQNIAAADRVVLLAPNGRDHVQRARHSRRRFAELAKQAIPRTRWKEVVQRSETWTEDELTFFQGSSTNSAEITLV